MSNIRVRLLARAVALVMVVSVAFGVSAETRKQTVASDVKSTAKTSLLKLEPRKTSTVTVAALSKADIKLWATVTFYDERGQRVAVRKGVISQYTPLIATLTHDDLNQYDSALIRAEVLLTGRGDDPAPIQCPVGIGMDHGDGPVLTSAMEPCNCGTTVGGHVFLNCETVAKVITSN